MSKDSSKELTQRVATIWTKHLNGDPDAIEAFREGLGHQFNSQQWKRLKQILSDFLDQAKREMLTGYDDPGWPYKQSHLNGYEKAIRDIINLMPIDQKDIK